MNKKATAEVLIMIRDKFTDLERHYLIDRYRMLDDNRVTNNMHRMLVGKAHYLISEMLSNGATKNELDKAIEYMMVCIDCQKFNLNVKAAQDTLGIDKLFEKYMPMGIPGERVIEERKRQLERAAKRRGVLKLHAEGKTNEQIAQELDIPESTVRFFLRRIEKAEKEQETE